MEPLVTVLLPVYNGREYLRIAIDSVLGQTYSNIELLVVDDGSKDDSVNIVMSYNDDRVRLIKQEKNGGIVKALNAGIENARGVYTARMDADDICKPERIQRQVEYLEANPAITMVDTIMEYIDGGGKLMGRYNNNIVSEGEIVKAMRGNNCLGHSSIMIRTGDYLKYKYRQIWYEDDDLWLRLLNDGKRIHKIAEPLLLYRIHSDSIITKDKATNKSLLKLIETRLYYYTNLPLNSRIKWNNILILGNVIKLYLILQYKKLKGLWKK